MTSSAATPALPLAGVRVLDLSRILAGPWSTQILADLGAEVIKVERPGSGDDTRSWGPPYLMAEHGSRRESAYFLGVNRSKRSIAINLREEAGRALVRRLARTADVVVENFKVGTLERMGLSYSDLSSIKPDIIYCSITGFGQTGPRRQQPAYDFAVQALGGLMSVTGDSDERPGGGPQKVGIPIVDLATGTYASAAILAALVQRERTGVGAWIDIAMLDVQVSLLSNQAMNHLIGGVVPRRTGNRHPNIQPQDVYACSDGDIVIAVGNDAQFAQFAEVLKVEELRSPLFIENADRVRNLPELDLIIRAALVTRSRAYWIDAMATAGIPCAPINDIDEVFRDPQVISRGLVQTVTYADLGEVPHVGSPIRFVGSPTVAPRPAPSVGEHTDEILEELVRSENPTLLETR